MYGTHVTLVPAAAVHIPNIVVILAVLLVAAYVISTIARSTNRKSNAADAPSAPAMQSNAAAQDGHIDAVLVTAAVAAYLGKRTDEIVVHSIRRIGTEETAWSRAGRLDSLQ